MFRAIKSFLGLTDDTPARPAAARARLGCESLESREVLSAYMSGDMLVVSGTSGNDTVTVGELALWNKSYVAVNLNGTTTMFAKAGINKVYCNLGLGDDRFVGSATVPCTVLGGDGNDYLRGGRGADTLFGQSGDDTLVSIDQAIDTLYGNVGFDSFWANGTSTQVTINDAIVDVEAGEGGNVHRVGAFANGADLTLNGDDIADPTDGQYYERFDGPLFSKYGPLMQDIYQGETGDCWLLSTLSSAARQSPNTIRQTIVELGDGTYAVELGNKFYRVDADLPTTWYSSDLELGADLGTDDALWVALVEKAFTHHLGSNTYASLNSNTINTAMTALGYNSDLWYQQTPTVGSGQSAMDTIATKLAEGRIVAVAMVNPSDDTPCIASHGYAVQGVSRDASGKVTFVTLRNPWGKDGAGSDSNTSDGYVRLTATMFSKSTWAITWTTDPI